MSERIGTVVVGGGQAGLAAGYHLARRGLDVRVIDRGSRAGESWRRRWDSLRLFTPLEYNHLPGLPFDGPAGGFPTKDETATYLERYAETLRLDVRWGCGARSLRRAGDRYHLETELGELIADQIVVATGPFQRPRIPAWSRHLSSGLFQVHSGEYRNPATVPRGRVLVVGTGNSGAQIARELARDREVFLAGPRNGRFPRRFLGRDVYWWVYRAGLMRVTATSLVGRWLRRRGRGGDPLVGLSLRKLVREEGITLLPRAVDARGRDVRFANGRSVEVDAVVWATGFTTDFAWIDVPVFDLSEGSSGGPMHRRGITGTPGLYFLGLRWLHRLDSSLLAGVGRDAAYVVEAIARRSKHASSPGP